MTCAIYLLWCAAQGTDPSTVFGTLQDRKIFIWHRVTVVFCKLAILRLHHLHDFRNPRKMLHSCQWAFYGGQRDPWPPNCTYRENVDWSLKQSQWQRYNFTRKSAFCAVPTPNDETKSLSMNIIKCSRGLFEVSMCPQNHREHDEATQRPISTPSASFLTNLIRKLKKPLSRNLFRELGVVKNLIKIRQNLHVFAILRHFLTKIGKISC